MTRLWLHRSKVKLLRVKADSLVWHSALTFPFVPKYQPSMWDILTLAHCSMIGAPVRLNHSEKSKCQTPRAALQPNFNTALCSFYTLKPFRLFLLPRLGSLWPQQEKRKRGGQNWKGGRGAKRGKRGRSQARTFIFRNTLNEYLVVQSNYRLVGKYGPTELQKIHIIDPIL